MPAVRPADAHDIEGTFDAILDPVLRAFTPRDADELEDYLRRVHRRVMGGRRAVAPGEYKERGNPGMTVFVHRDLVRGTLREGFTVLDTLDPGWRGRSSPCSSWRRFISADGNGRVARLLMNAELSSQELSRVAIPLSYRDEYMSALRALSRNAAPIPLWRMLDRAQRRAVLMTWTGRERVAGLMEQTHALVAPEQAAAANLHLRDP